MNSCENIIRLNGYLEENLQDYKKASMFLAFPNCSFKCAKELGLDPKDICQNYFNIEEETLNYNLNDIWNIYIKNTITEAFVFGGLEPLDTFEDVLKTIKFIRARCNDDIVIYTGYYEHEILDKIKNLKEYKNIYLKCGRYKPNCDRVYDKVLGVNLSNEGQYGIKIS